MGMLSGRLMGAGSTSSDRKVVDLRGVLVDRLEERLDLLQDTHRDVVAAAYDNLAGTNQIHRAVISIIRPQTFADFLTAVATELAGTLAADGLHICLEGAGLSAGEPLGPKGPMRQTLIGLPKGGVDAYFGGEAHATRKVVLRPVPRSSSLIYGTGAASIRSEAILRLDFGAGRLGGMLAVGSDNPARFTADQATDLLDFLASALECVMQRWLS